MQLLRKSRANEHFVSPKELQAKCKWVHGGQTIQCKYKCKYKYKYSTQINKYIKTIGIQKNAAVAKYKCTSANNAIVRSLVFPVVLQEKVQKDLCVFCALTACTFVQGGSIVVVHLMKWAAVKVQ